AVADGERWALHPRRPPGGRSRPAGRRRAGNRGPGPGVRAVAGTRTDPPGHAPPRRALAAGGRDRARTRPPARSRRPQPKRGGAGPRDPARRFQGRGVSRVSKVIVGVGVGGTTTGAGRVNPDGQVVGEERAATHTRGPGTAVDTIVELIESVRGKAVRRGLDI